METYRPVWIGLLLSLLILGSIAVLLWAPLLVSIGYAVAAAILWCIWLERHPAT